MADITEVKRKDGKILKVGTKVNLTGKSEHGETGADVWEKNPEDMLQLQNSLLPLELILLSMQDLTMKISDNVM